MLVDDPSDGARLDRGDERLRRLRAVAWVLLVLLCAPPPVGAAQAETWRGLTVVLEHRCSPYDRKRDYPYPQSVECEIVLCPPLARVLPVVEVQLQPRRRARRVHGHRLGEDEPHPYSVSGHDKGAIARGKIASLFETCKVNGGEPYSWRKGTLVKAPAGHPQSRIDELLLWNFDRASR